MPKGEGVPGEEKLIKPAARIYQALFEGYAMPPYSAPFIDDKAENVKGAEALGLPGIHSQNPQQLEQGLRELFKKVCQFTALGPGFRAPASKHGVGRRPQS